MYNSCIHWSDCICMARVKVPLPSQFPFRTEIPIRISDINYGGHLGNDAVLSIAHEARIQFLRHLGYTEFEIDGTGILMTDATIVYAAEGLYGDLLIVDVGTMDFQPAHCDVVYRLTNKTTHKEIARLKTGIVFIDKQTRKITAIPESFRKKCGETREP